MREIEFWDVGSGGGEQDSGMEGSEGYGKVGSDYYYSATGNITNFEGTALY